jgi:hypothetical protein
MPELKCPNCGRTDKWIGSASMVKEGRRLRCGQCLLWFTVAMPEGEDPTIVATALQPSVKGWRTKTPCAIDLLPARLAYHDPAQPEKLCEHCGRPFTGPALFCSIECSEASA